MKNENKKTTVTRFPPSPTGFLHIGGLRTALYAYLAAVKDNGRFLLRIEDTDQNRLVEGATENIIEALKWAGINYDEGPDIGGPHGPYIQSQRLDKYQKFADQLVEQKKAYRCFCTKERLDQMREDQIAAKKAPMYDRTCRYLSDKEIQEKLDANTPYVIRQAIPLNELVKYEDKIRGKLTFDTNTLDDHVLMKSDGYPTYHLAVVVDDNDMEVTLVLRGEEWLPSTPKHLLLYEAFDWVKPEFGHLPLILNKDKTKLSKRQNDVSVDDYIKKGYSREALINFIALLGWNTSDNEELFSMEDLKEKFDVSRIQKSGAIFDLDKLNWFQWQWNRRKHLETLTQIAKQIDPNVTIEEPKKGQLHFKFDSPENQNSFENKRAEELLKLADKYISKEYKSNPLVLISVSEKILQEPENINDYIAFYFKEKLDHKKDLFLHEKMGVTEEIAKQAINSSIDNLTEADFKSEETLKNKFIEIINTLGLKTGQVLWPIRVALTAEEFSPGVFELAYTYGHEKTIERLKDAIEIL